jgi:hypothetical protein
LPPQTQAAIRIRRRLDVSSLTSRITLTGAPASPIDTTALTKNAATVHTPAFIKSLQMVSAFVQSIPFSCRVTLYAQTIISPNGLRSEDEKWRASVLRASLLADLACEQASLRLKKRNHGLTEDIVMSLLPRLAAFCQIELAHLPVDCAEGKHILELLATFTAYMKTQHVWYEKFLPGRRYRKVTKVSTLLINNLIARTFSTSRPAREHVKNASCEVLKQWKRDVSRVRDLHKTNKNLNSINLKGRAFAGVLGSIAGGSIEYDEDVEGGANSITGRICTEFDMLFTPGSGSVVAQHEETMLASKYGTARENIIASGVTANQQATLDLAASPPVYAW